MMVKTSYKHVWQVIESDGELEPGFYFEDETADFNGPYETAELAKADLLRYIELELLGDTKQ